MAQTEQIDQKPFTPLQLADRWEVTPAHIRNMCRRQELPHFKVGINYRIRRSVVYKWEEENEIGGPPTALDPITSDSLMVEQLSSGTKKTASEKRDASTLTPKSKDVLHSINLSANGKAS